MNTLVAHGIEYVFHIAPLHYVPFIARSRDLKSKISLREEGFAETHFRSKSTDIALTFADYISSNNQNARRFEQLTLPTREFIEELELVSQARVTLINTRFPRPDDHRSADLRSLIDRRSWRGNLTVVPELRLENSKGH